MSGNNDLLEKARMEKIIMSLENERKAFNNNRRETEMKLENTKMSLEREKKNLCGFIDDWTYFNEVAPPDENGKRPNPVILNEIKALPAKETGYRLQIIEMNADTKGYFAPIGKLFRFDLVVRSYHDMEEKKHNRFYIVGANGYKYLHNHGHLAKTPEKAAYYFVYALEHLPRLIEYAKKQIELLETNIPVLEKILETTWNNAPKLQKIRNELAAIDRKIKNALEIKQFP